MSKRSRRTRRHVTLTLNRREFLNASRAAAFAGVVGLQAPPAARGMTPAAPHGKEIGPTEEQYRDNIYTRLLGVRPHLPAHEHISRLSGSRMPPEVTRAMAEANEFFVDMHELIEAAGKHCADAVGAEAALITSGAFSAMVLGAAACLTGTDQEKIEALPQVSWPKRECLIQKIHRFDYDRAYRAAGMTIVEAETREQFVNAISEKTAMIAAISAVEHQVEFGPPIPKHRAHDPGPETMLPSELVRVGKKAGVPVLVDFASDIPPDENLTKFVKMGADLVVLSGGKALRGPQSAGILAGRKDLIDAASLNAFPNANIGRGMKVGKEEVIGLVVALDRYLSLDMKAIEESWTAKAQYIADQLKDLPGVRAVVAANTAGYTDVDLSWDERIIPFTEQQLKAKLKQGDPPLIYDGTTVRTRCLWQGEEVLVARRLKEVFLSAVARG